MASICEWGRGSGPIMTPHFDVICVGDADVDIYLDVDHIPQRDEKILASGAAWYAGGMVANCAAALSRLGSRCLFHGPVGDDEFGHLVRKDLQSYGVDVSGIYIKQGAHTYYCVVMLDNSGEKALVVAPTEAIFPIPIELDRKLIASGRHMHTTAACIDTAMYAARVARENGLSTSLDLEASVIPKADEMSLLLKHITILFVNHQALKNTQSLELHAAQLLAYGPAIVCITRGAAGCLVATHANSWNITAFAVPVVDSTGAGDTFAAGFIHSYLQEKTVVEAAEFASAVAALNIQARGGHGGSPTLTQVEEFMKRADRHNLE